MEEKFSKETNRLTKNKTETLEKNEMVKQKQHQKASKKQNYSEKWRTKYRQLKGKTYKGKDLEKWPIFPGRLGYIQEITFPKICSA